MKKVVPMLPGFSWVILVAFFAFPGSSGSWHQRLTVILNFACGKLRGEVEIPKVVLCE
jgi:hypothetical protein